MLRVRLPLPPETRKSSTYRARVDTMKIVIGVLADDILGVAGEVDSNLSLNTASTASTVLGGIISGTNDSSDGRDRKLKLSFGDLDPRNLAQGHKEEVTRVAEILCWLAKKMNYVSSDGKAVEKTALSLDASLREWCNSSSKHLEEQKQWMDRSDDDSVLDLNSQEMERSVLSSVSASTEGYGSPLRHSVQSLRESRTTTSGIDEEVNSEYNIEMSSEFSHQFESMSFLQDGYEDLDPPMGASDNIIEIRDEDISLPPLSPRKVHSPAHLKSSFSGLDSDSSLSLEVARGKPSTASLSYCHCEEELSDYSIITPALRTTGDINLVNFENEMTVYESWRERSRNQNFQCRTCSHSSDQSRGSQYQNSRKSSFSVSIHNCICLAAA